MSVRFSLDLVGVTTQNYGACLGILQKVLGLLNDEGIIIESSELNVLVDRDQRLGGWTPERQAAATEALFSYFSDKSQKEIADTLGIAQGSVSNYSRGGRMNRKAIIAILNALQTLDPKPPAELLDKFRLMIKGDAELGSGNDDES